MSTIRFILVSSALVNTEARMHQPTDLKLLPPWYPVRTEDQRNKLMGWLERSLVQGNMLAKVKYSIVGCCRAREELAIRLEDGRFARVCLPEPGWLVGPDEAFDIQFFVTVDAINDFILRDFEAHQ